MNLTLNDFRAVLGKVNDGNVVFKQENGETVGIKKVNYGWNMKEPTPNDVNVNRAMRQSFINAISNSPEARRAGNAFISDLCRELGLGANKVITDDRPLDRRTISAVIQRLDRQAGGENGLIPIVCQDLRNLGMLDVELATGIRCLLMPSRDEALDYMRTGDTMKAAFDEVFENHQKFNGFTKAEFSKFIDNNAARIKMMAFDRLYLEAYDAKRANDTPAERTDGGRTLLWAVVDELMSNYGKGKEPVTRVAAFVKGPPRLVETKQPSPENTFDQIKAELPKLFPLAGQQTNAGCTIDRLQQKTLLRPLMTYLETLFAAEQEAQNAPDEVARNKQALAEFRTHSPAGGRLLDLRLDVLAALSPREKTAFVRVFQQRLLENLATVDLQSDFYPAGGCEKLAKAVADVLEPMIGQTALASAFVDVFRAANEGERFGIPVETLDQLARQTAASAQGRSADAVKLMAATLMHGLDSATFDAPGGLEAFERLQNVAANRLDEFKNGPEARKNMFLQIGGQNASVFNLPYDLRTEDRSAPKDEEAKILAGKIAFLKTVLPKEELVTAHIIHENGLFINDDPESERLAREAIDGMIEQFTNKDLDKVMHYFVAGIGGVETPERDYFKLMADGVIGLDDLSREGAEKIQQLLGGFVNIGLVIKSEQKFGVNGRNLNEVIRNIGNGYLVDQKDVSKWEKYDFTAVEGSGEALKYLGTTISRNRGTSAIQKKLTLPDTIRLMASFGLKVKDMNSADSVARYVVMLTALGCHGGNPDGLAAWVQRMTGFDVRTMSDAELPRLAQKLGVLARNLEKDKGLLTDPIEDGNRFSEQERKAIRIFSGKAKISEAVLTHADVVSLLDALSLAGSGDANARAFKVGNLTGSLRKREDGTLEALVFKGGKEYLIEVPRSAEDFRSLLVTKVATHPQDYPQIAESVLPTLDEGGRPVGMTVSRAREICVKVLVARLDKPAVTFAHMSLAELLTSARGALAGTFTADNLPTEPSKQYNAADVAAVQQAYVAASDADRLKVKTSEAPILRTDAERRANPPDVQTVHNLVSELFLNLDTSVYDRDVAEPAGTRLQHLRIAYDAELSHFKTAEQIEACVNTFPSAVRESVRELLQAFVGLKPNAGLVAFSHLEDVIAEKINRTMEVMQGMVSRLFAPSEQKGEAPEAWKQSLGEMTNVDGLDPKSPNGKFVRAVLSRYFKEAAPTEKRAMLAAFLRNTRATGEGAPVDPSEGVQVGELMKGAGPVLQKMLQGLPIESFGPETQAALRDMKSALTPIPDPVIRAQLLDLIQSSNGNVLSVEVKKTIGCATVGQAILCHIKTKTHPYTGEDVVIKVLRPNVQTAALREHALLAKIARETGGETMAAMFEAQFAGIVEEMDFTREAENIDVGSTQLDRQQGPKGEPLDSVRSMRRLVSIPPTSGVLVLEKVPGDTLDRHLRKAEAAIKEIDAKITHAKGDGNEIRIVHQGEKVETVANVRRQLADVSRDLIKKRKKLEQVLTLWIDTALFRTGFFHGDMHSGNLLLDKDTISFIDFGNVATLTPTERSNIAKLFMASGFEDDSDLSGSGKWNAGSMFLNAVSAMLGDEAKASLAQAREELKTEIETIMTKGRGDRIVTKTLAALAAVQRKGIALPPGLNAFIQSLARLQGALSQIDGMIDECRDKALVIKSSPTAVENFVQGLEPFKGKIPGIELLEQAVRRGAESLDYGNSLPPVKNELKNLLKAQENQKQDPPTFVGIEGDPFEDKELKLFYALQKHFEKVIKFNVADMSEGKLTSVAILGVRLNELKVALSNSNEDPDSLRMRKEIFLKYVMEAVVDMAEFLGNTTLPEETKGKSFEEIVSDCFVERSRQVMADQSMGDLIGFAYGTVFLDAHHKKAEQDAITAADALNKQLPVEQRVGQTRARQLAQAACDFQLPNGVYSLAEIKKEDLPEVLRVNFAALRRRLALPEDARLTEGEVQYLAAYFLNRARLKDVSLSKAISTANALRQMTDHTDDPIGHYTNIKHEGCHPLATAILKFDKSGELEGVKGACQDADILAFMQKVCDLAPNALK